MQLKKKVKIDLYDETNFVGDLGDSLVANILHAFSYS